MATEAHAYLTIGNFNNNSQTNTVSNPTHSSNTYGSYYFIVDVSITRIRGLNTKENELNKTNRTLIKVIDFMGRETEIKPNTPLIYIYSDGSREGVFKFEGK